MLRVTLLILLIAMEPNAFAQTESSPVKPYSAKELESYQSACRVKLSQNEVAAVKAVLNGLPAEQAQRFLAQWDLDDESTVAFGVLAALVNADSTNSLKTLLSQSGHPLLQFTINYGLAKEGKIEAAKRLLSLRDDRDLAMEHRRMIRSLFGFAGISWQVSSADEVLETLKPPKAIDWIGKQAPDFTAETTSGKTIRLSRFRGKFVVLHFWATWCGPCVVEMPEFASAIGDLDDDQVIVVAVSLDFNESDFAEFLKKNRVPGHKILSDNGGRGTISNLYSVRSAPSDFVIDPDGIIRSRSWRDLAKLLKPDGESQTDN